MYSKIYESEKIKTTYILKRKECVLSVSLYLSVVTLTAGYAFTPLVYPLVLVPSLCLSGETEKYSSHFFFGLVWFRYNTCRIWIADADARQSRADSRAQGNFNGDIVLAPALLFISKRLRCSRSFPSRRTSVCVQRSWFGSYEACQLSLVSCGGTYSQSSRLGTSARIFLDLF